MNKGKRLRVNGRNARSLGCMMDMEVRDVLIFLEIIYISLLLENLVFLNKLRKLF